MDKEYWENYYKNAKLVTEESPFAKFFVSNFKIEGTLIELGCGNGRDAAYFASKDIQVLGTDQCHSSIGRLNELNLPNAIFEVADFTNLSTEKQFDNIYSRFTLHSVEEDAQERVIAWASKAIRNGYFAIEVRSVKDSFCGQGELVGKNTWFKDNHSRRFVECSELHKSLVKHGFEIIYEIESNGLAVYKNEDPVVIRVIARKR